jgi:hypothetical protein
VSGTPLEWYVTCITIIDTIILNIHTNDAYTPILFASQVGAASAQLFILRTQVADTHRYIHTYIHTHTHIHIHIHPTHTGGTHTHTYKYITITNAITVEINYYTIILSIILLYYQLYYYTINYTIILSIILSIILIILILILYHTYTHTHIQTCTQVGTLCDSESEVRTKASFFSKSGTYTYILIYLYVLNPPSFYPLYDIYLHLI